MPTTTSDGRPVGGSSAEPVYILNSAALPVSVSGTSVVDLPPSTIYRNLDLGTTGQVVKASAGELTGYFVANRNAAERFVKVYNKATAPTGSDTPVATIPLAGGEKANISIADGLTFSAGISLRASTGIADNDAGAPSTNDIVVTVWYR